MPIEIGSLFCKRYALWILFTIGLSSYAFGQKQDRKSVEYPPTDFQKLVNAWNKAHTIDSLVNLDNQYSDIVYFYQQIKPKTSCIEGKRSFINKHPDYRQETIGKVVVNKINNTIFKCNFTKRTWFDDKFRDYPSYLIFEQEGNKWIIITESDSLTDQNILGKSQPVQKISPKIRGDYDGDGVKEDMWRIAPKINMDDFSCEAGGYIMFSNPKIPSIPIYCGDGIPDNLGDLNNDGQDEIGIPSSFDSCWGKYDVLTLKNNKWTLAIDPITTFCDQWFDGIFPIRKDNMCKGNVIIHYSYFDTEGNEPAEIISESVKIQ